MTQVRFEIFNQLINELNKYHLPDVADAAGVSYQTLSNWVSYKVQAPQLRTFIPVAETIGFDLKLVRRQTLKAVA